MLLLAALLACTSGKSADTGASDDTARDTASEDDSATSNDTGTTDDAVTPESFVSTVVPLVCGLLETCEGFEGNPDFSTYDECVAWLQVELTAYMETCVDFDAAAAAACVQAEETATCADATEGDGSHFAACDEVCSPAPSR